MTINLPARLRRGLALALALLLATFGLSAVPAHAASPTVEITAVADGGGSVTISGRGFSPTDPGIYLGIGKQGLAGFYAGSTDLLPDQTVWISPSNTSGNSDTGRTEPLKSDGTFSFRTTLPEEPSGGLAAYTSKAHGQGFADPSQNTTTEITYSAPTPIAAPKLTVSGPVPHAGGKLTVKGTGFDPAAPGIYVGVAPKTYAGFYAANTAQAILPNTTIWVAATNSHGATTAPMNSDGSFTTTVELPAASTAELAVFASKAHNIGQSDPSQNASAAVTYAKAPQPDPTPTPSPTPQPDPTPTPSTKPTPKPTTKPSQPTTDKPRITTTKAPNGGGLVTVRGTGFDPSQPGIYLGVGKRGATGFYAADLLDAETLWISTTNKDGLTDAGRTAKMANDGSFTATVLLPKQGSTKFAVYTSKAHGQGMADTSQDIKANIAYAKASTSGKNPAPSKKAKKESDLTSATRGKITVPSRLVAGQEILVKVGTKRAGQKVDVVMYSTPTILTSNTTVSSSGTVSAKLPATLTGNHRLAVYSATGKVIGWAQVSVSKASSAATSRSNAPTVTVSRVPAGGGKVTVSGKNFTADSTGIYVALGTSGQPGFYQANSAGALLDGQTVWVATGNRNAVTAMGRTAPMTASGSFSLQLTVPAGTASGYTVYTSKAHGKGTTDTSQNVKVALSSKASSTGTGSASTALAGSASAAVSTSFSNNSGLAANAGSSNGAKNAIAADSKPVYKTVCTANAVSGATLTWGVKDSFRNYIRSGIAKGGWTLTGASYNGSDFTFGAGSGSYSTKNSTGNVQFGGSVHFSGHDGVLDLRLSGLRLQQTSASTGSLIANVSSSDMDGKKSSRNGVAIGTVSFRGASVTGSRVAISNAPVTLTAAGAKAFAGFYEAGESLDALSANLPLGEGTNCSQVLVKDGTGAYATGGSVGSTLASTGAESTVFALAGIGSVLLGSFLLLMRRRRRFQV
ncbi:HtaA domain-containing protein [Arthrobacter rhombi]|uniref:HtaA domain-containing protein n=1 Tax=Arthrobacter rhombi TaxID=71253 RepID=UPI003FD39405